MANSLTKEQGLQITTLNNEGKPHSTIANQLGITIAAVRQHCANARKSPSLSALSNRTKSKAKAHINAVAIKTRDTKYTVLEFKPDPNGPFVNATMTDRYLGLELSYRR
ncbi:hypothetical protein ACLS0R_18635 [Comamonas jiangduensis]|uniref:hypothetical protein n=1 Tax=Comamonas TaxID=283 RepID=UPI001C5792C6|nr:MULTISPECIES: hypothetical protein [Comamonas]QXW19651.1 hypothetical protein KXJ72_07175 [Comamonas aquatica]